MKAKLVNESIGNITTEDCVNAIVQFLSEKGETGNAVNPKNWKRKSKTGSEIIVREFFNSKTNQTLAVTATLTDIVKIEVPNTSGTKITVKDVNDWTDEFQEDPIVDGPIYLSETDEEEFMKSLPKKYIYTGNAFDGWNMGSLKCEDEEESEKLIKLWVDFINKKGYKNGYQEMINDTKKDYIE